MPASDDLIRAIPAAPIPPSTDRVSGIAGAAARIAGISCRTQVTAALSPGWNSFFSSTAITRGSLTYGASTVLAQLTLLPTSL